jgi:hypothetical protein
VVYHFPGAWIGENVKNIVRYVHAVIFVTFLRKIKQCHGVEI